MPSKVFFIEIILMVSGLVDCISFGGAEVFRPPIQKEMFDDTFQTLVDRYLPSLWQRPPWLAGIA